jgi:hypothetical protein
MRFREFVTLDEGLWDKLFGNKKVNPKPDVELAQWAKKSGAPTDDKSLEINPHGAQDKATKQDKENAVARFGTGNLRSAIDYFQQLTGKKYPLETIQLISSNDEYNKIWNKEYKRWFTIELKAKRPAGILGVLRRAFKEMGLEEPNMVPQKPEPRQMYVPPPPNPDEISEFIKQAMQDRNLSAEDIKNMVSQRWGIAMTGRYGNLTNAEIGKAYRNYRPKLQLFEPEPEEPETSSFSPRIYSPEEPVKGKRKRQY